MICANIDAFSYIEESIRFKNITNHCIFSGSDVGSKWWLLCSLLHPKIKHLNRLGDVVDTCSGVKTMADCWQLTQGGSVLKGQCSWIVVGGALACVTSLCQESVNGLIWDSAHDFWRFKKKSTGWIFIIIGWLCTHTANTHLCSNTI